MHVDVQSLPNKLLDSDRESLCTVDKVHKEVHEGEHFTATYLSAAVANNASLDIHIVTGAAKVPHTIIEVDVDGKSHLFLYETITTSGNGTGVTPYNNNRNSALTATTAVYHTPTVTGTGTLIKNILIPGGTKQAVVGSSGSTRTEWILKASTKYLLRVTNKSGSAIDISAALKFYEHGL